MELFDDRHLYQIAVKILRTYSILNYTVNRGLIYYKNELVKEDGFKTSEHAWLIFYNT